MSRTERESGRRNGRLVGDVKTGGELAEWRGLERKNLRQLEQLKNQGAIASQSDQLARTPEPPLRKRKGSGQSVQIIRL